MKEPSRTLAWICPACRQSVIVERSVFSLTAAPGKAACPCGKSEVKIEPMEDHFRITVPCLTCGKDHQVTCSQEAFLHQKAVAFSCAASGLDCFYAGEEEAVFAAVRRLEEAADHLPAKEEKEGEEPGTFLNDIIMQEVLGELKDIASRPDGVSCSCGSGRWRLKVGYSAVDLICADCGGALRIPAATDSDLDDLCCKHRLVIKGR